MKSVAVEAEGDRDGLDSVNVAGWVAALAVFIYFTCSTAL